MFSVRLVTLFVTLVLTSTRATAQAPVDITHEVLTIVDLPNAVGSYGKSFVTDRNAGGLIVGGFSSPDPTSPPEGSFSLTLGGTAKLFHCGPDTAWTQVKAVNIHKAMVGWCMKRVGGQETVEGFYRSESAQVTRLNVPGALITEAWDVNDSHVVVGWYLTGTGIHGFRWTRSTGKYDALDAPFPGTEGTLPSAINGQGHIVATVFTPNSTAVGGLLRQGQWTPIALPGATTTLPEELTDQGAILGVFSRPIPEGSPEIGSFLLEQGTFSQVATPWPQPTVTTVTALAASRLTAGFYYLDLPSQDPANPGAHQNRTQGFVAPLGVLLSSPITPPPPQMAGRMQSFATSEAATAPAGTLQLGGCPDEAPPEGVKRVGKLAMSWLGCARLARK
jgi:hypothetical protein